jgi:hypothetical protein
LSPLQRTKEERIKARPYISKNKEQKLAPFRSKKS